MPIYNHQPAKIARAGLSDEKGKDHLARIPFQGFTIPKQTLTASMWIPIVKHFVDILSLNRPPLKLPLL